MMPVNQDELKYLRTREVLSRWTGRDGTKSGGTEWGKGREAGGVVGC